MHLTALPIRLVIVTVNSRCQFGVWCQPLSSVVFSDDSKQSALNFLEEFRTLVNTGMSYGAALSLMYSVR
jgi:hypothetical protein